MATTRKVRVPDPIDIEVGTRIRLRRKELRVSQSALAEALNLTFQQVQKYERGANRVSASMLVRTAKRLECSVSDLVGEEPGDLPVDPALAALCEPGVRELVLAFTRVARKRRQSVLELVRSLAD